MHGDKVRPSRFRTAASRLPFVAVATVTWCAFLLVACEVTNPAYDPYAMPGGSGGTGGSSTDVRPATDAPKADASNTGDVAPLSSMHKPIAYWPFEDKEGTTMFEDASGNRTKTVLEAAACSCMSAPGHVGNGLKLSAPGVGELTGIRVVSSPLLETTNFAISVTASLYQTETGSRYYSIFSRRCGNNTDESFNLTAYGDHFELLSNCNGIDNARLTALNSVRLEQWVELAATFDGSEARLYVNGVLMAFEKTKRPFLYHDEAYPFFIGTNRNYPDAPEPFIGTLDDVAVWNRALTAAEVMQIFQGTSPLDL